MSRFILALCAFLAFGACGQKDEQSAAVVMPSIAMSDPEIPSPQPTLSPAAYLPPVRSHNYDIAEDRTYSYIAGISEDERKRGKAAGDVLSFRYMGRNADDEIIIANVTQAGAILSSARCPETCVVIRYSNGSQIAYNTGSVIGAVFEDAIKGRLKLWLPPPPPKAVYYDEPSDIEEPLASPAAPTIAAAETSEPTETKSPLE